MSMKLILAMLTYTFTNTNAQSMQYIQTKAEVRGIISESTNGQISNKPVYDTYFILVKGNVYKGQTPISVITTDEKGRLFLELPIGVYCIVEQDRPEIFIKNKITKSEKWDNGCLRKKWQKPLVVINVENMNPIDINFENQPFDPKDPGCKR